MKQGTHEAMKEQRAMIELDPDGVEAAVEALRAIEDLDFMVYHGETDEIVRKIVTAYLAQALRLRPMSEAPEDVEIVVQDHHGINRLGMVYGHPGGVEVPGLGGGQLVPPGFFRGWAPAMLPQPVEPEA